jgi:glyoxylase-like metal-dependent hydrolase (beta-lactamase superfamily II)
VLHTPGHTPEHISLVVTDPTRGPEPWFVLTGHTLMVGDMGRTELATSAEEEFVALMLQEIPPRPERAAEIRAENLAAPATVEV